MRDRFKRSVDRLFLNPERFGELFRPFFPEPDHPPVRVRKRRSNEPELMEIKGFGSNPGNLRMLQYVPVGLKPDAPLVVVLHGCCQTAESYDRAAGWAALARELGFCVLYPEQKASNNPRRCFSWFRPSEVTRDRGELASIRQMIGHLSERVRSDRARTYITGLSAGGAMTAAMLANYPELFAGGTIIAGLPFGAARDARRALAAMHQAPDRTPQQWGDLVRAARPDISAQPVISIWHGTEDETVSISNAEALASQWIAAHGLDPAFFSETRVKGRRTRRWRTNDGRAAVSYHRVSGFGHGTPVTRGKGGGYAVASEPFMLEAGFSSTLEIARGWGLIPRGKG